MQELHGESPVGVHAGEHKKESRTEGKSERLRRQRKQVLDSTISSFQVGQSRRFNPWQQFVCSMIPEALERYPGVSHLAKMLYARLARYAGQNGDCYPAQATLATALATNERQIRRALTELIQEQFLETDTRGRAGTRYYFLWHPCFEQAEPLPKHPTRTPQVAQKVEGNALKNPDIFDRKPDKLSAQENQEENKKERNYNHSTGHAQPLCGGSAPSEITEKLAEEYITLRSRFRVWQGLKGQLPKLLVPCAYTEKLRREYRQGMLRTADFEDLKVWALNQNEVESAKQRQAAKEAYEATPEGQAQSHMAAQKNERIGIDYIKQKFRSWRANNQGWIWEKLAQEAEEWTPVLSTAHWYELRFKYHIPTLSGRIRVALHELVAEDSNPLPSLFAEGGR